MESDDLEKNDITALDPLQKGLSRGEIKQLWMRTRTKKSNFTSQNTEVHNPNLKNPNLRFPLFPNLPKLIKLMLALTER